MYYKNIHYLEKGLGKKNIIFLHGWGGSINQFSSFSNLFENNYNIYLLDLPAFGKSKINTPYGLDEYADEIIDFIVGNSIQNPIIVGHSFGGRVALKILERGYNFKTILISTPGFDKKSMLVRIKLFMNKYLKISFASKDYKAANPLHRKIMNMVFKDTKKLNYDKINSNVLIIHGTKDYVVKPCVAKMMEKRIKKSQVCFVGGGHFPYLDEPIKVYRVIDIYANS